MAFESLKAELATDPLGRGYQNMTVDQVVASLNTADRVVQRPIPNRLLLRWAAQTDGINLLKTAAASGNKDKRRISDAALAMISSFHVTEFDVSDPELIQLLAATVVLGILSQADVDALKARGQVKISRAEELGLGIVTRGQVLRYKQE